MEETADATVPQEVRRGDESSFVSLYHRHRIPLFRFAWRLTGSIPAAEDVVQECWAAVIQRNRSAKAPAPSAAIPSALSATSPSNASASMIANRPTPTTPPTPSPRSKAKPSFSSEFEDLSLDEIARIIDAESQRIQPRVGDARAVKYEAEHWCR